MSCKNKGRLVEWKPLNAIKINVMSCLLLSNLKGLFYLTSHNKIHRLMIIQKMWSKLLSPKVITLSSFHFTYSLACCVCVCIIRIEKRMTNKETNKRSEGGTKCGWRAYGLGIKSFCAYLCRKHIYWIMNLSFFLAVHFCNYWHYFMFNIRKW